jgi:hypothetical protein
MRTMPIPRFSIRALLASMAVSALISLVLAEAVRGRPWGVGFAVALASVAVLFVLHVVVFAVAWLLARLRGLMAPPPQGTSPFATAGPPRQYIPPAPPRD